MKNLFYLLLCTCVCMLTGCGNDDEMQLAYEVPDTYTFANVSYSGQTQRLDMLTELKAYIKTTEDGATLDLERLQAMYANDATEADWLGAYETSKQLRNKTFGSEEPTFDALLVALAADSESTQVGSPGQAGLVTSTDGSKRYLLSATGLDRVQLIEKGLMGAVLYYQATGVYFTPTRMDVDNTTVTPGEGTEMEHHFDEAFGYFGVEPAYPDIREPAVFWGNYANQRDAVLNNSATIMAAFRRGRAAISNNDLATRDAAITEVRTEWERIAAASAIHYLNVALEQYDDIAIRNHVLSEAIGFIYALQFNPESSVSLTQVRELLTLIGGDHDFADMSLYPTDAAAYQAQLGMARQQLADYVGLQTVIDEL